MLEPRSIVQHFRALGIWKRDKLLAVIFSLAMPSSASAPLAGDAMG